MMSGWSSQSYMVPMTPEAVNPLHQQSQAEKADIMVVPETPMPGRHLGYSSSREFCTKETLLNSVAYINQEFELLGLPCIPVQSLQKEGLDSIFLMNRLNDVLVLYHKTMAVKEELELRNHRLSCDLDHQHSSYKRLKRSKEQVEKEANQEREKLRQLNSKYKSMSGQIKADEEEVRKLTAMQGSRDLQYKHEQKKKEKEMNKLKERLHQLLADKAPDRKVGMDIMSLVGGSNGRRATWKTGPVKQEEEMYQVLVSNYEESRQELMQENAELRDCLLSLQRELSSLLKRTGDINLSAISDLSNNVNHSHSSLEDEEEEDSRCSRLSLTDLDDGYFQMPCDIMRNQIQQMFKDTCDQISQSMKKSLARNITKASSSSSRRGSLSASNNSSERAVPDRKNSVSEKSEVERLKKQIVNYKSIIEQQEDLIQQTLSSHSHSMESSFFHESQLQKEKMNLSQQKKLFAEERGNFEKERRTFTEAAIRLAKEKKNFDADRAALLKQQFLNLSPFKGGETKSKAKADCSTTRLLPATPVFSPSKSETKPEAGLPTTAELFKALGLTKSSNEICIGDSKPSSKQYESPSKLMSGLPTETATGSVGLYPGSKGISLGGSTDSLADHRHPTSSINNGSEAVVHASQASVDAFSPRIEEIKASLLKKHMERSKSTD